MSRISCTDSLEAMGLLNFLRKKLISHVPGFSIHTFFWLLCLLSSVIFLVSTFFLTLPLGASVEAMTVPGLRYGNSMRLPLWDTRRDL